MSETERIYQILSKAVWFISGLLVGTILTIVRFIEVFLK